ncbi:MAG: CAAX prenyl protease-related protein [Verrucomicrobia bacterium]|nr:MAG: CAAX prenyl protease-related protein [Verrucomicrobiota bacterium]
MSCQWFCSWLCSRFANSSRPAVKRFSFVMPGFRIYPAQTILCAALLIWFRRCYQFHRPKSVALTLLIGLAVFGIWTAPQYFLHFAPRPVGFDPTLLESNSAIYWSMILFRFLRLVVVVPLAEEVFWRGFLLRFVIDEHFERVPFGKFNWLSRRRDCCVYL